MKYLLLAFIITGNLFNSRAQQISRELIKSSKIKSITSIDGDGRKLITYFNSHGDKKEEGKIKNEAYQVNIKYLYNEKQQLIEERRFNSIGDVISFKKFYYTNSGKIERSEYYYDYPDKVSLDATWNFE